MKKVLLLFFTIVLFASGILFANGKSSDVLKFSPDNAIPGYDVVQSTTTITTFPWTEGFESGALPTDWTQVYVSGTVSWTYEAGAYSSYQPTSAHTGSYNALLYYGSSTRSQTKLITPELDLSSLLNPQITFWHAQAPWGSDQDMLRVYYRPASDTNWVLLASYTSAITTWTEETISLTSIPATEPIYIAFEGDAAYGYGAVLDDITVEAGPTCPKPTALVASNLQSTSADLSWTAGSTETTWDIEYKLATDATWTSVPGVTTNPYPLTGLTSFSLYNWRVKAICGASDESTWTLESSFRTPCEAVSIFPITEGFENASFPPSCWTVAHTQGSSSYTWISGTSYYHTGSTSAQLQDQAFGNKNNLVSPLLDIPTAAGYQVTFWIYRNNTGTGCPNEGVKVWANFNPDTVGGTPLIYIRRSIDIAPTEAAMGWYEYTATIPDAGLQYIIFEGISDYCYITYMDDITIGERPTCPKPSFLTVIDSTITTTSATFEWTVNGTETAWILEYKLDSDTIWTVENATSNPYTISTFSPSSSYDVRVKAVCGIGDESDYCNNTVSFQTECLTYTTFPYFQDFENSLFPPLCWTVEHTAGTSTGTWIRSTYTVHTGTGSAQLQDQSSGNKNNLVTPQFDIPTANTHEVRFWMYRANDYYNYPNEGVKVWTNVTPDTVGGTSLIHIRRAYQQQPPVSVEGWYEYSAIIPNAGLQYIIFEGISEYGSSTYLDNITIGEIPTCISPTNLTVIDSTITTTSASFSWTPGDSTQTAWILQYKLASESNWNNAITENASSIPYNISNLLPSTAYEVRVKADCGNGEESYWAAGTSTFITDCIPIQVPYTQDFDNIGNLDFPICWNKMNSVYLSTYQYFNAPNALEFYSYSSSTPAIAIAPLLDIDSVNLLQVTFNAKQYSAYYDADIQVGVMTDPTDISSFTNIQTVVPTSTSAWDEFTVSLSSYHGIGQYIAIKCFYSPSSTLYGNDFYLDNVLIDSLPDCQRPENVTVTNITTTTADVSWMAQTGVTEWTVEYKPLNATTWNVVNFVTATPYFLTGLDSATTYEVRIKTNCSPTSESAYSLVYTFSTLSCDIMDQCDITIIMTDSYGDGWNGGKVAVSNNGIVLGTATISSGTTGSASFFVCPGSISFSWISGSYDSECSFIVIGAGGDTLYVSPATLSAGILMSSDTFSCPLCKRPYYLTVDNITASGADISWISNQTDFTLEYKISSDTIWTIVNSVTSPYNLTGLSDGTVYDIRVKTNCGVGIESIYSETSFLTICLPITTIPFLETFEANSPTLNCWSAINNNEDDITWNIYTGAGYEHSGTQFAGIYTDGNAGYNDDYLISPNIVLTGNEFLSFFHRARSSSEPNDFEVLLSTTGTEPADFTTVLLTDTSVLTTYSLVNLDLTAYTGNVYIAFHIPSGGLDGWYLFIDDVSISTCPLLSNVAVSSITPNSATVSWIPGGTETAWEIQYKLVSDATWTVVQTTTNPYILPGLTDASSYEVKVRAVCGPADSSYFTSIVNFTTACLPVTTFPIIESFDNSTSIPPCWSQSYVSGSGSLSVVSSASHPTSTPYNGTGMIYFNSYNFSSGVQTRLVSPLINSSSVSGLNVSFRWFTSTDYNTYTNEGVMVQYSLDGTNWTDAGSLIQRLASTNAWTSQTVSLPAAVDNQSVLYVGFLFVSQCGNNCLLDSIYIGTSNPIDTCDNPINLTIPSATLACDSAIAIWAAGGTETMWTFEYKRNADPDFTSVVVTTPTFTMTGLLQLTQYNIRVKALCGTGDESGYTTASFTTPQCGVTSYIITASATSGGAISPSGDISVVAGGNQTFTMTPDDITYYLASLVVDGVITTALPVYSFNGVNANHTIHAVFAPVGINENNLQNSVVIFPNPANDLLNVKLSQEFESVEITNMLGQLLYSNRVTDSFLQINISSYTSGVYFIRLKGENGLATKKFIKE